METIGAEYLVCEATNRPPMIEMKVQVESLRVVHTAIVGSWCTCPRRYHENANLLFWLRFPLPIPTFCLNFQAYDRLGFCMKVLIVLEARAFLSAMPRLRAWKSSEGHPRRKESFELPKDYPSQVTLCWLQWVDCCTSASEQSDQIATSSLAILAKDLGLEFALFQVNMHCLWDQDNCNHPHHLIRSAKQSTLDQNSPRELCWNGWQDHGRWNEMTV